MQIKITIEEPELFTKPCGHFCHCSNYRRVSESYVAADLLIEEGKVTIRDQKGILPMYLDKRPALDCHLLKSVTPTRPGMVIVKKGIFPRIPKPEAESFADHRHDWQGTHDGLDQYKIIFWKENYVQ